ncbi:hypothetical protein Dda_2915 [Drechslerella dactyloides]|uniref:Uncharacterized protein n=1 Tax=Drechslerella dactyloides TaxID=74499 RepID=A0AAD6J2P5_DREDA|nr:hypothetical protein Dda_2915 [Drechslerella dactyloides]
MPRMRIQWGGAREEDKYARFGKGGAFMQLGGGMFAGRQAGGDGGDGEAMCPAGCCIWSTNAP